MQVKPEYVLYHDDLRKAGEYLCRQAGNGRARHLHAGDENKVQNDVDGHARAGHWRRPRR